MHKPGHGDNRKAIKKFAKKLGDVTLRGESAVGNKCDEQIPVGHYKQDETDDKKNNKLECELRREKIVDEQSVQSSSTTRVVEDSLFNLHLSPQHASTNKSVGGSRDRLICMTSEELDIKIKEKLIKREQQRRKIKEAQLCSKNVKLKSKLRRARRINEQSASHSRDIEVWHQKYDSKKALELAERSARIVWLSSFYRYDPRWQILTFFNEVARDGGIAAMDENLGSSRRNSGASSLTKSFSKANIFTVWRPTSNEAIKNMMLGIATGKGLDIKGKSAKRGNISSYVPFIQIYEDHQKEKSRSLINQGKLVRVYYQSVRARNEVYEMLLDVKDYMQFAKEDAYRVLNSEEADPVEQSLAMKHLMWDDSNMSIEFVDTYSNTSHPVFGLDISECLFWESYVMMQDFSRPAGTEWDIGRKSEFTFMDMNFKSIRHIPEPDEPRVVIYQMSKDSPIEPRMLVLAYEELGRVKPVVSDFDCFLLGSRGVRYKSPISKDQAELVQWSVKNIGQLLDERAASRLEEGWMDAWFKILRSAALKGYYPKTPRFGNGDPKSYKIIEVAVSRLNETGCVRHGAECFNWFFPQEIDDRFLVISDTLIDSSVKWKMVNVQELQDLLIAKIEEGFTFPINPKWVLCDPGWRRVYSKLLASNKDNVQDSINCWLPPDTGLREDIDSISARHPFGFETCGNRTQNEVTMNQMLDDFERYLKMQRAWRKLRLLLYWFRYVKEKQREKLERQLRFSHQQHSASKLKTSILQTSSWES